MTTDVNTLIDSVIASAEEYQKRMSEEAKNIFAAVSEAMKEHPLLAIKWQQYTPYFNDGEECTFSVHELYLFGLVDGEEIGERYEGLSLDTVLGALKYRAEGTVTLDPNDWYVQHYGEEKRRKQLVASYDEFRELTNDQLVALSKSMAWGDELTKKLSKLPNDVFRNAFGDHVEVTLTGEGAEVSEYSHD